MVSKKILGVAIAAALSSSAFADVVLDAGTPAKVKVAKATLATNSDATNYDGLYYTVTKGSIAANDIDLGAQFGVNIALGQSKWIRVDLTNAIFTAAPALTVTGTNTSAIIQGGLTTGKSASRSSVVFRYDVTASTGTAITQTDVMQIALSTLGVSPTGAVGATIKVYSSEESALANNASTAYSATLSDAITVVDGFAPTITANTLTADVENLFKKFANVVFTNSSAVGTLQLKTSGAATAAGGGAAATLAQQFDIGVGKSKITLTGDFSNADYYLGADCTGAYPGTALAVITDVSTTPSTPVNNTKDKKNTEYTFDAALFVAAGNTDQTVALCAHKADNATVLNPASFNVSVAFDKTNQFTPAVAAGAIGSIVRNGTTIQVPFVSTFADYKQRLVLVNRGTTDAAYSITFTSEEGTTATAGTAATGTLKAGKTTVLDSTNVVTLTGATTRTAATVVVAAPEGKVDAVTTMVNTADKSTDTVKLK